ncbi:MAG: hypothetical protein LBQ89_04160 [Treponema sp.]|jgi:hypothetical protein|nr:hypothetical protein [Treponema sp.]
MKNLFLLLFFIGAIFDIYTNDAKSISIEHIGWQDSIIPVIVINAYKEGYEVEPIMIVYAYFMVQESTFDDIIELINNNGELFSERMINERRSDLGTFRLHIENDEEEYYLYLLERKSSALFYSKLYNLIREKEENSRLLSYLESEFWYFHFIEFIPEIGITT